MRQNFTTGQEIVSEDLNYLQGRIERGLIDRIVYEIIQRKSDGFFQNGFQVLFQSSTDLVVKKGLGFQTASTTSKEPVKKPLVLDADATVAINSPDSSNGRIDLICVKHGRYNAESENRKFKDEFTDTIQLQSTVVATDWKAEILYVPGSPSGSPVAPAVPAGYMLIAEVAISASIGITGQSDITDKRSKLPFATSTNPTGTNDYDAVVGDITQSGVTHADLKSALDNAEDGWKILVLKSEELDAIPVVLNNDIEIVFKRGVTLSRGIATIGLQVDGNDCRIINARIENFNTGGDRGIKVSSGALRTYIDAPRFKTCATNIEDLGSETYVNVEYSE